MLSRKHYIFKGAVQGVGFRYRAYYAAGMYGVKGFVRNLSDGSVELEAEGEERNIIETVKRILNGHFIQVDDIEVRDVPVRNSHSFEVLD